MRIAIAADHAGFKLKEDIVTHLTQKGHTVVDLGTDTETPVDYPPYAVAVGNAVRAGAAERGVLICGSGIGASIAANKLRGIRAGVCHDTYSAHQGVEHDDMNVLVLGARVVGVALGIEIVNVFLGVRFSGEERHLRRLCQVRDIEIRG